MAHYVSNYINNTVGQYAAAIKQQGLTQITFTPAQTAELNKLAESVRTEWIKGNSKDFDAQGLFDFTAALFARSLSENRGRSEGSPF